jgi:glutathione S-transferase
VSFVPDAGKCQPCQNLPQSARQSVWRTQAGSARGLQRGGGGGAPHWLAKRRSAALLHCAQVNAALLPRTFLVANRITLADLVVFGATLPALVRSWAFSGLGQG